MADRNNSERLRGFCNRRTDRRTDGQTDGRTDICDSRVAFATENSLEFTLVDEKLLHKNSATAFCSSTVKLSKSFGYFMRCRSFLSICKKLQKSSRSDPTANNRINFARISAFSDLDNTKYATKYEYSKYFEIHGHQILKKEKTDQ